MQRIVKVIAAAGSLASCVFGTAAQNSATGADGGDALLRAAYCVGVLKESIRSLQEVPRGRDRCETSWFEHKYKSLQECSVEMRKVDEAAEELQRLDKEKHKRYAQYLLVRMIDVSPSQQRAILAVVAKGEKDSADKRAMALGNPATSKCLSSAGDDLVACVARHDQTYANVLRCLHMADQLPF